MSGKRRAYRTLFFAAVCACGVCRTDVHAVTYDFVSVSANRAQVRFVLDNNEIGTVATMRPVQVAFTSSETAVVTITARPEGSVQSASLPLSVLKNGWAGRTFLQWFAFSPFVNKAYGGREAIPRGLITIEFGSPVIQTTQRPWIANGVLHLGAQAGLRKTANLQKPVVPFSSGLRMFVEKDGIYQLNSSDLKRCGVPVDRIQSIYFKIYNNGVEVPLYVTNSHRFSLGTDDAILFYATSLRGTSSYNAQFSNSNAYWLTWQPDRPGVRIADVSGARQKDVTAYQGSGSRSITAREFLDTIHLEQDNEIVSFGSVTAIHEMADTATVTEIDNWYWGPIGKNSLTEFIIQVPPPTLSSDASKTARMRIRFQGVTSDPAVSPDHRLVIYLNGDTLGYAEWDGQNTYDFTSSPFLSSRLTAGDNTVTFASRSSTLNSDQSELNWIEIEYFRSFNCLDDRMLFKNSGLDTGGVFQFTLKGFAGPAVDLWDLSSHRLYTDFETSPATLNNKTTYTVVFQDSCIGVHRYCAQSKGRRMVPSEMALDTIRAEWDQVAQADYIIVTPDSFQNDVAPLVDTYKKRGMTIAVVDISDVYNAFSHGVRDPESIRTMLRYVLSLASSKPPRYLLLGGDTTHDLDKKNRTRNIIPTHLSLVSGWGPSSDDGYFATVIGSDDFPDLFVGRFPAQSRTEMKNLVAKAVNYLTGQETGPWHDNILMAGGAESDFTSFNEQAINEVIGSKLNVIRLDGDPASRFYRDASIAAKDISGYINAGVYAINFNGHGGGLVWSDSKFFSYSDLDKLYNGQWSAAGRLPFVFSFTCLTGFFESPDYRSLGEEFVRVPKNGAIGFFGASAYTSKLGNLVMDRVLLDNAVGGSFESVGELLWLTKINMLARSGREYLPLVRQYNFLGDPALPWLFPPDTMTLTLAKQTLGIRDTLTIHGACPPVTSGQVKITAGADFRKWNDYVWNVSSGSFSGSCVFKDSLRTSRGFVHAFAWNDSSELRGWTSFSRSNILFKSVSIAPATPHYGDSVRISARIDSPDSLARQVNAVLCLYAIAPRSAGNPAFQGVSMFRDSEGAWNTAGKIPLAFHGTVGEELLLKFREVGTGVSDTTDIFRFPILGRPDLLFAGGGPGIRFQNDSLFVHCEVVNAGTTTSPPFSVSVFADTLMSTSPLFTFDSRDSLAPGKTRQLYFGIPDTQGSITFFVVINPGSVFEEIGRDNNSARVHLSLSYLDMQDVTDSLFSKEKGVVIVPCSRFDARRRVFLFSDTITASQPLATESRWTATNDSVKRFWVGIRPALSPQDSLAWTFVRSAYDSAALSKKASISNNAKLCVCRFDPQLLTWRYAPSIADSGKMTCRMRSQADGPCALSQLSDTRPPQIRASVYGREIVFLDYAAKGKPLNLFLSDASGVVPSSIKMALNNRALDSGTVSRVSPQPDLREFSVTAYPKKEYSIDSLTVVAQDLAGNTSARVFAYMAGEDLAIKSFSCHPNPFSAKQDNNGSTIQTIRFAFLLTDVAKEAKIVIYTIANRVVWTWQKTDGTIGYQEVPWNGKTSQGYRIANGTYYAKLTVKNDSKKATSITRIAKLEGF